MKKRFLCLIMALCLFAALLPVTALADSKPDAKFDFFLTGQDERPTASEGPVKDNGFPEVMLDTEAALTMHPGDGAQYYVTTKTDSNFPDNTYLNPGTEDNWNVKFEYPADGIPTVTLKDANIVNRFGLWFGGVNIPMTSDIKIILEGDNHFEYITPNEDMVFPAHGLFNMNTTGTVTITGSGKLSFASDTHSYNTGVIMGRGDIVLDHVEVFMSLPETKGKSNGIHTTGGDIIMKGGSWTVDSYDDPDTFHAVGQENGYRNNQEAIHSAVFAKKRADGTGGNFVVEDGAKVLIMVSPFVNKNNNGVVMYTEGKFTIRDSTVEIGLIGKVPTGVSIFSEKPTFEYADDTYYIVATKAAQPSYTPGELVLTPAINKVVDWFNFQKLSQLTYFKITPGGDGGPTCEMPIVSDTLPPSATFATTATTASTKPTTAPTSAPTSAPTTAPTETTPVDTDTQKDSGNGVLILIIVLCVLALAGGGFALYWFVFRKRAETEVIEEEAEEPEEESEEAEATEETE